MRIDEFIRDAKAAAGTAERYGEKAAKGTYDFLIGDDIRTLRNPLASPLDKTVAAVSIASNFAGPEGKLVGRGLSLTVKLSEKVLEHGLADAALEDLEKSVGKDALTAADKAVARGEQWVRAHSADVEKYVKKVFEISGALANAADAPQQVAKTVADVEKLFAPDQPVYDRMKEAAVVAQDVYGLYGEVRGMAKGVAAGAREEKAGVNHVRREQAHVPAAERTKVGHHVFIETDHAIFDARGGKTITDSSFKLLERRAAEETRPVIVVGRDLDHATREKLARSGVLVVDDAKAAKSMAIQLRVPGVEKARLVEQQLRHSEVGAALEQHHRVQGTSGNVAEVERKLHNAYAGVGIKHEQAQAWNGKPAFGTVTFVEHDRLEQYVGANRWVTYDENQARAMLHGQTPKPGDYLEVSGTARATLRHPVEHGR